MHYSHMKTLQLCSSLIFSFLWLRSSQLYANIIKSSSGLIQGIAVDFDDSKVVQYLGIPFAEPPVGQLRFQKPQSVKPWYTVLIADKPGPACVQFVDYPYPLYDMYGPKSEDCLYLNIWVPQTMENNAKKSVMFWIYGGGYTVGSNQMPVHNGTALAAKGDIIVVTTNYRLSALGGLATPSETAPGNIALYDILEALKWVNKNIEAFGGDPDQVTVAGQSVGSTTAAIFCVSPLTKGLFRRVIMESGSPTFLDLENKTVNMNKSQRLAEALGCADNIITIVDEPDEVVNCLREKSAYEIIMKENSFHPKKTESYYPFYGSEFMPTNPRHALLAGKFHDVDVLIGNTQDDGAHLEATAKPKIFGIYGLKNPNINKTFGESLIDDFFEKYPVPNDDVKEYYLGNLQEYEYDEIRTQVYIAMGDAKFFCPTKYFAEIYGESGNNVYYYLYAHRSSTTPWAEWMKVTHSDEVQFVFGQPLLNPESYTSEESRLSLKIIEIWTNFVKYGSPESPQEKESDRNNWPLYTREQPKYIKLTTKSIISEEGPHQENCDFLRPFLNSDT